MAGGIDVLLFQSMFCQSSPVYILSDAETTTELCLNLLHVIGATGVTKNELSLKHLESKVHFWPEKIADT